MFKLKFQKKKTKKKLETLFLDHNLKKIIYTSKKNDLISPTPYKPKIIDIYKFYQFISLNEKSLDKYNGLEFKFYNN